MSSNGQPWQHLKGSSNPPDIFGNLIHNLDEPFLFSFSLPKFEQYRHDPPDCSMLFLPVRRQTSLAIGCSSVCSPRRKQSPEGGELWQQVSTPYSSCFAKKGGVFFYFGQSRSRTSYGVQDLTCARYDLSLCTCAPCNDMQRSSTFPGLQCKRPTKHTHTHQMESNYYGLVGDRNI